MEKDAVFRFDGGATWLNLLATQGQSFGARPVERLPTPDSGSRWLTRVGYPPKDAVTPANLDQLVLLREALRGLAMAAVAGRDPSPDALAHVRRVASALTDLAFTSPPEHGVAVETALGMIAIQALVTLQGPDRELLKECAESDCRWVFLDTSGRRHWCPSPSCASRGRVRAHRARQAAGPSV
jgi:predicted RNA-binding Zn ribbon-like protein